MESAGRSNWATCGDYSTKVINRKHLSSIDLKMSAVEGARISINYMI